MDNGRMHQSEGCACPPLVPLPDSNTNLLIINTSAFREPESIICRVYHDNDNYIETKAITYAFAKPTASLITPETVSKFLLSETVFVNLLIF